MNNFTKNTIVQKIIIVLVFLTIFNFIYPYIPSFADDSIEEQNEAVTGGILLSPIVSLITTLGDGVINVCQKMFLGMDKSFIHVDNHESTIAKIVGIGTGILAGTAVVAGAVAITVLSGGTALPAVVAGLTSIGTGVITGVAVGTAADAITKEMLPDDFYIPLFAISPAEIFAGSIPALDVNFINPQKYVDEDGKEIETPTLVLQSEIAKWYVALRNFVLVAMMIVLLYIGIRIIISSTASEKAKYKEHIQDWLVSIIILVFMHYIMAFALNITEKITDLLAKQNQYVIVALPEMQVEDEEIQFEAKDGKMYLATNLMGQARIYQQLEQNDRGNSVMTWDRIGYTVIYIVLVMYTVMFLVIYLKRVIYIAFLTVISPLVALTYPIDKLNDGKAQAFDMWLKEYMYNLLLQPFHLLIYTVLVGTSMGFAAKNMLYAIVAIGFLLQAEKLLRKFFGFEKAATTGDIMGSAVGGAMAMKAIDGLKKLSSSHGSDKKKGNQNGNGGNDEGDNGNIRTSDNNTDDLLSEAFSDEDYGESDFGQPISEEDATRMQRDMLDVDDENYMQDGWDPQERDQLARDAYEGEGMNYTDEEYADILRDSGYEQDDIDRMVAERNAEQQSEQENEEQENEEQQTQRVPINNSQNQQRRKITKSKAAGKIAARYVGKGLLNVARKAPNMIGKLYGAATFGALGAIAGLASDNYSNVLKYGAAGGATGYAAGWKGLGVAAGLGGAAASGAGKLGTVAKTAAGYAAGSYATNPVDKTYNGTQSAIQTAQKIKAEYEQEVYGKDYQKHLNAQLDEKWQKNKKVQKQYKDEFGEDDYQQAMEDALKYREHGIVDDKLIIKTMQLDDDKLSSQDRSRASKERIGLAKVASSVKSNKELDDYGKRLQDNGVQEDRIRSVKKVVRDLRKDI